MAVETKSGKKGGAVAPGKKSAKSLFDEKPKQDDLAQLWQDVQERPLLYAGIAAFLVACLFAGLLYSANAAAQRKKVITAYAQALDKKDPAEQLAALEPLTQTMAKKNDEIVYITGETAYRAGEYDKAKAAFERMHTEFTNSPYTPEAVEGLGNIAENAKDYDNALAYYTEVKDKWANSFAARRQPMNIAKMEERRGRLKEAIAAYREQMQVFPGSTLADEASAALNRLEKTNPDLFPKPEAPVAPAAIAPATSDAAPADGSGTKPGDLDVQLKAPDIGSPENASDADTGLKLKAPDVVGSEAAAPSPAESAPVETPVKQ